MMRQLPSKLLITLISLLPALVWALPADREQPINIEADHAQLDDKQGITQYKGTAILTQGTLRLEGDIITFYYDEDKQLSKAVAEGKHAKYQQVHKPGEAPVRARALKMEYIAKTQKIYLIGQGHIWQAGDEFSGSHIEYDISNNIVNANSAPVKVGDKVQKGERIHIIIQPPGSKKTTKPATKETKPAAISPPNATVVSQESDKYSTALTTVRLNARSGPDTQYPVLDTFEQNTHVIILTEQNNWVQVRGMVGDKIVIGWVNRRYLQLN